MKHKAYLLLACFAFAIAFSSCSKDDGSSSPTEDVVNIVSDGTWRITYFFNSDTEETSDFAGYNFTFGTGNSLTASNGILMHTGTWSLTTESGDDNPGAPDFNIAFAAPATFTELTEDWDILTQTTDKIALQHISGGDGGTDMLTFEKN